MAVRMRPEPVSSCKGFWRQVRAASTSELLRARWCEPALSVVDVRLASDGGDMDHYRFGPSRFSVVPHAVVGNVSVRFVPDQVR